MSLFGVVDVMVMHTTDKHLLTQYPYEYVQQQAPRLRSQLSVHKCNDFFSHFTFMLYNNFSTIDIKQLCNLF